MTAQKSAPREIHPAAGGSYTRQADGSLTKNPPLPSNPKSKPVKADAAAPAAPAPETAATDESADRAQRRGGGARHAD
jgi:hypothetical protein